jgi:hypothetical protein
LLGFASFHFLANLLSPPKIGECKEESMKEFDKLLGIAKRKARFDEGNTWSNGSGVDLLNRRKIYLFSVC